MLLLRSNGTLLHMKDCIITFVKLIISKKHNFILYNALTNRDSPNFPLPSNPLPQIVTSNPRLQPDTHFAVDMFPYKKTELFQKSGFKSKPPKKPGNTPLSGTWFYFLDIKTTESHCHYSGWKRTLGEGECSGILKVPNKIGRGLVLTSPSDRLIFSSLGVPLFVSIGFWWGRRTANN